MALLEDHVKFLLAFKGGLLRLSLIDDLECQERNRFCVIPFCLFLVGFELLEI